MDLLGRSINHYHITEQLGQGGMAIVYKAFDTHLDRDVAIKVIRTEQFAPVILEKILKRFEREAKLVGKLSHPNIVGVIDYGEFEGSPYLVMPYLDGGTLKSYLGKRGVLPWQEAVLLLLPVAEALQYAHEHNVLHRDVKPSNILLTDAGQPMLTDFGVAKVLEGDEGNTLTGTGVGLGTPEYMAPEQWQGQFSAQSDIYSLGVVLYEMVTGVRPYTADTPAAVLIKQITGPLRRPQEIIPDLPEKVEQVLYKSLAIKPEDRYGNMGAFCEALQLLEPMAHRRQNFSAASTMQDDKSVTIDESLPDVSTSIRDELQTEISQPISLKQVTLKDVIPPPVFPSQEIPQNPPPPIGEPGSRSILSNRTFWISLGIIIAGWFAAGVVWFIHSKLFETIIARGMVYPEAIWYVFGLISAIFRGFSIGWGIRLFKRIPWGQAILIPGGFLAAQILFDLLSSLNILGNPVLLYTVCFGLLGGLGISLSCSRSVKLAWWKFLLIIVIWISDFYFVYLFVGIGPFGDLFVSTLEGLLGGFLTLLIINKAQHRFEEK